MKKNENVIWQKNKVSYEDRCRVLGQQGKVVWFTGLSGSGKSTIAVELEKMLNEAGKAVYLLDGDNIRCGINSDLGFSDEDRVENIRRIAEVAKLMNDAGLIVITAFISPYRHDRENAKQIIGDGFREVYVSTSIEECEKRDVKGLYKAAREGKIAQFTGITSPYEIPEHADVVVDTAEMDVETCVNHILEQLKSLLRESV